MGDLNAGCSYFDGDLDSTMSSNDYYWCINNRVDATTKSTNCAYDRIIITNPALPDPYPVYAEFRCNRDTDSAPVTDSDRGRNRFKERYGGGATEPGAPEVCPQ